VQAEVDSEEWLSEERALVARARKGERDAVAALYRAFAARIYQRVLMPRLGNSQAAEDALSETFRTAIERLEQFDDRGMSIYFWLSRIAVNKATDMHRVKQRTRRALTSFEEMIAPLRPSAPRPERAFEDAERAEYLKEHVSAVLSTINPRYRRAIELRFIEEKSREECARDMDVKLGTYDVLLLRALRAFRKEWDKLSEGETRENA
jgi:RNA polymerase sigma factor (sigma-70 family)